MFMNQTRIAFLVILCSLGGFAQTRKTVPAVASFHNTWTKPLVSTPSNNKVDAPLMGNGDVTMSVGRKGDVLSYYLSKNDFWRLVSPANFNRNDDVSGPRTVGSVNIQFEGFGNASFAADQRLIDGVTTCSLTSEGRKAEVRSWVSATEKPDFYRN
jgi:alpha-L-fucosidase 2